MAFLDKMMKDCGLEYSVKGDMSIRQRHLYIGVIFDTLKGRLYIGKEKFSKLMEPLAELMQQAEASARLMSKLRGKMGHQLACMSGVVPLLVPFNKFVGGPETTAEWDRAKPIPPSLRHTMGTLYKWLPSRQEQGAEMWPLDPRTILFSWEIELEVPGDPLIVVFWDASPDGAAGISIRHRPGEIWETGGMDYSGATSIATFDRTLDVQVHHESAGEPLVMQLLRSMQDIRGKQVLFVNDCLPVIQAMKKGSGSEHLQKDAEYMAVAGPEAGAALLFLHVQGRE
jgi:hypothetical protein